MLLCFFVLVKFYHKKNKKFKTGLMTSFILLLLPSQDFTCSKSTTETLKTLEHSVKSV